MKLSQAQNKLIEEYWMNIDDYRKKLKFREWELIENKTVDTNIGGGKSNRISDTTGNKAILLSSDENYQHTQKIINAIEKTYLSLDEDMKIIVNMRYWDKEGVYEWEDIADKLYISRSKVLRKRNLLIDKTAEKLGWM
ncbi:MAG: transcriptional regulator [Solibacillus isronensis]